jgi:signal transduction histidine kinase
MEKWQDPKTLAIWIAIILVLVFTIILFVVKIMHTGYKRMVQANLRQAQMQLEHQKKLTETSLQAQEKERTRIASDLHDSLIGKLTVIRMKSQLGLPLTEIDSLLGESITDARRISHDLTPPLLEQTGIADLIDNILDPWRQKMDIIFYTDIRSDYQFTPVAKIQIVRVVQELITNIVKHAAATAVTVHLRTTHNSTMLTVKDNGNGFDTAILKKGLGLHSLEMRMQYLSASYKVKSAQGRGTRTIMVCPHKNETDE